MLLLPPSLKPRPFRSGDDDFARHESPSLFVGQPSAAYGQTFGDGKAIAWFIPPVPDDSGAAQWVIWIHPDSRHRRIRGRRLGAWVLDHMKRKARRHGCTSIRAVIRRDNQRSVVFHERLGFHRVDVADDPVTYLIGV
jgi:ribosomal protein S18 acetylase RimI-like enzyme